MRHTGMRFTVGVLGAAILLTLSAAPASATFPGRNGRISFGKWAEPEVALTTINPDGTDRATIAGGAAYHGASWSPSGRWIVVARGQYSFAASAVVVMRPDGSDRYTVTTSGDGDVGGPSFSADGRRILYSVSRGARSKMFSIRRDGTDKQQLAAGLEGAGYGPTQSPDGRRVAFAFRPDDEHRTAIYTQRSGGGDLRRLTPFNSSGGPDWSPDSDRIVFTRMSLDFERVHIFRMPRDGRGERQLTRGGGYNEHPVWSPNGRWIVYQRHAYRNNIRLMRPDGSDNHKAFAGEQQLEPSWQPLPD